MPTDKPRKQKPLLNVTAYEPIEPEDDETVLRFKRFAAADKNYVKALKRLMDLANVEPL